MITNKQAIENPLHKAIRELLDAVDNEESTGQALRNLREAFKVADVQRCPECGGHEPDGEVCQTCVNDMFPRMF